MAEKRKLVAILAADVVGFSRLTGADEDRTLARLRALRSDLIDPTVAVNNGRVVKRTGDGALVEFRSVVDAVRCAIEVQDAMLERNSGLPPDRRIEFRIGIHLGDVVEESDGDLMGDGVNIAARLEGIAEPGAICLSEDAYRQVRSRLDLIISDLGETRLKNIAEPMRIYSLKVGNAATLKQAPLAEAASTVVQVATSILPDKPSIAVLPFDNMSNDPEQEYFSDGISEDAITDLSKISALFVVARNSSFCYKGKAVNIQHVARELNVRYVVEGSVRKVGNRVRITAQLIDAQTSGHLWADRYDRELNDIFAVQDEITKNIVSSLQLVLLPEEKKSIARAPTTDFQAYDFYLKGRQCYNFVRKAKYIEARQWFERAIECDSNFARAYCGIADCGLQLFWWEGGKKNLVGVFEAVTKALNLAPKLAEAHASMGLALSLTGDRRGAEQRYAKAVELDPHLYEAHFYWARNCFEQGNLLEAAKHFENAWRVSPRDPQTPGILLGIYRDLNRDEDVKTVARKTLEIGLRKLELEPDNSRACISCAFSLVHLGRYSEVIDMIDRVIKNDPSDKINYYNIACLYAIMGQTDDALDMLEASTLGSGRLVDQAKNDGDFDSLRNHPRFIALIEQQTDPPVFPNP